MSSEMWQFAAFLSVVAVAFVLWLNIIYLPGRTLEQRYDGPGGVRESGDAPRRYSEEDSHAPGGSEATPSSSDPTR